MPSSYSIVAGDTSSAIMAATLAIGASAFISPDPRKLPQKTAFLTLG